MTNSMTTPQVILFQLTCPGDQRAKGVQFQLTCNQCQESHRTQVWLCFLVVSFLSISTCAADHSPARLKTCLQNVQPTIEKSDAMLYAPSINDIKDNCKARSLQCYIFELMMVLDEEEVSGKGEDCIFAFNSTLQANPDGCPPCEVHALKNITVFLDRLNTLLEKMTQEST
ncbi:interleukin-15 [Mastacembelus armatus]|uniref:Interleukin n=1 Tax=Mastacembelus armatus TaxID=205130 RepID=A0A3Q3MKY3_9TELE|nr:interleukin-15-like [Mastacembelus armatus]